MASNPAVEPCLVSIGNGAAIENIVLELSLPGLTSELSQGLAPPWSAAHWPDRIASAVLIHDILPLHFLLASHRVGVVEYLVRRLASGSPDTLGAPHAGVEKVLVGVPRDLLLELVPKDIAP